MPGTLPLGKTGQSHGPAASSREAQDTDGASMDSAPSTEPWVGPLVGPSALPPPGDVLPVRTTGGLTPKDPFVSFTVSYGDSLSLDPSDLTTCSHTLGGQVRPVGPSEKNTKYKGRRWQDVPPSTRGSPGRTQAAWGFPSGFTRRRSRDERGAPCK